ncbi:hypothetical protein D9M72_546900 [compost metagenome]
MMKRGVSASNASGSCTSEACPTASCHQTSRPSAMGTVASWSAGVVRLTTSTCSMALSPATAASALSLTGTATPRRNWPSVVTRSLARVSSTRNFRASAENPPNTREWMAPMRATARVMMTVSGMTGR